MIRAIEELRKANNYNQIFFFFFLENIFRDSVESELEGREWRGKENGEDILAYGILNRHDTQILK